MTSNVFNLYARQCNGFRYLTPFVPGKLDSNVLRVDKFIFGFLKVCEHELDCNHTVFSRSHGEHRKDFTIQGAFSLMTSQCDTHLVENLINQPSLVSEIDICLYFVH